MEWCIRQLRSSSSTISYNITSIAYNQYTNIYPLLYISIYISVYLLLLLQSDSNAEEAEKGLNPEDLRVLDELEAAENNQNTKGTSYVGMEDLGEEMQQYDEDDDDMTVASAVTTKSAKSSKTSKSKGGVVANKKASKTSKKDAFKQSADAAPLQDDQARNTLKKVAKKGKKDARRGGAGAKEAYDFGMDF